MGLKRKSWAAASAIAVLCIFSAAAAQTGDTATTTPELPAQRDVNLTPQQMTAEADKSLPQMEQGATTVRRQLEEARSARDVVKVLCLNDKLNQIDVAIRSARDRQSSLRSAAQQNDADRSRHEFTVIQVLKDRVAALTAEANQCIGEETGFLGESKVTVEIDPNIPDTDPSEFPDDPFISQPPVLSSPTR